MKNTQAKLNAVIFETPADMRSLAGRERTKALSEFARAALYRSAELSGAVLGHLGKGDRGEPVPSGGTFWTLSHTLGFVAAVVAPFPVGIDIEKIMPVTPALRNKAATSEEWALAGDTDQETFCRFWTAKEAVLKAVGAGLGGLSNCRVVEIIDKYHTRIVYKSERWEVSHYFQIPGHVASITVPSERVEWLPIP